MYNEKDFADSIIQEYSNNQHSKVCALKKLDEKAKRPAVIFAFTFGIASSLVFGTGMCLAMSIIGHGLMGRGLGVLVGIAGLVCCGVNYICYKKILARDKAKYAKEILKLAREISEN